MTSGYRFGEPGRRCFLGIVAAGLTSGCLHAESELEQFEQRSTIGAAGPVEFTAAADREFEWVDRDEGTVRELFDSGRTSDVREFDDWADGVCRDTGVSELGEHMQDVLDAERVRLGSGVLDEEDLERVETNSTEIQEMLEELDHTIVVEVRTTFSRDGNKIAEPDVSFEEVVEATPRTVETTTVFEDREEELEVSCRHPVIVRWVALQQT